MKLCEGCGACFDDAAERCAFDGGALTIAFPGPRVVGGRYLLEQRISSGAMGIVFRAAHLQVGSTVAVKLMRPQQVGRRVALQRFRREAQILGQIKHPNAVLVIDFGVDEKDRADLPYLVMEFLRGEPLDDVMQRKRTFTLAELDRLLFPLCEAVEEAHQVGVIHRDLKPSNVFLERLRGGEEIVKVLDFGIAKFVELEGASRPAPVTLPDGPPVEDDLDDALDDNDFLDEVFDVRTDGPRRFATQPTRRDAPGRRSPARSPTTEAGFMIGTVPYMAPEQMTGESVSRRTDVHAVAVLAFQLLSGRPASRR
jgi:serine/threonine protein kinase